MLDAIERFLRTCGAASGRGQYRSASEADAVVHSIRRAIASLIQAPSSQCIALFSNGTTACNAAIVGVVQNGDHVVTTAVEHNSVLRCLWHLKTMGRISLTIVDCDQSGTVDADSVINALTEKTRLVAVTSASNVTGAEQPIVEIGHKLGDHPAAFLCDAAQSFGYLPINVMQSRIDLLAAPGHKGGGGPQGTGFLYVAPSWHERIAPSVFGGTGSQSESLSMPHTMPMKLEPGNLNVPALAGWEAGLKAISKKGESSIAKHGARLAEQLHLGLRSIRGVRVFGQAGRLPIASIAVDELSPHDLAAILDAEYAIETRAGLHCAARIHEFLGSYPNGTLRISGGATTTSGEIDQAILAMQSLADM
ncbi:putative cysteine desulfurase [Planctomycetes bacterium CA13]|uniref:Putative cysteine desulfurase n=1 Tax=Novipirellula herctigrandis TaxID=2527986 RepID=A0A5C5YW74_9BACT|nr:putative cysteine desulfurase [Planctomycetes bacterium CA13]